jgi:flagellar biosynthesis/type III secretory pathway protein FliH
MATTLGSTPLDSLTRSAISEARKAGYAEGHSAGMRDAVLEARSALERASELLDAAVASANRQISEAFRAHSPAVVELAIDIARRIVGDLPDDAGARLHERIALALEQIDDEQLVIRVSPTDASRIEELMSSRTDVAVVRDTTIDDGDALISGRWAQADLRLTTAWELVKEHPDA